MIYDLDLDQELRYLKVNLTKKCCRMLGHFDGHPACALCSKSQNCSTRTFIPAVILSSVVCSLNCTLLVPYIFNYIYVMQTNVHSFMLFNTIFIIKCCPTCF
jgi:hypothetical protein